MSLEAAQEAALAANQALFAEFEKLIEKGKLQTEALTLANMRTTQSFTPKQVGALLQISEKKARELMTSGSIRSWKDVAGKWVTTLEWVEKYQKQQAEGTEVRDISF